MPDVFARTLIEIEPGLIMTITANASSSGLVRQVSMSGDNLTGSRITNVPASASKVFGPWPTTRHYSLEVTGGKLSYTISAPAYGYATERGNVEGFTGSFTLKNDDNGKVFRCEDASNVTVTVPATIMEGFNVGFAQWAAGTITIAADTGATKRAGGAATSAQYQRGSVIVVKNTASVAAEYVVGGDFA